MVLECENEVVVLVSQRLETAEKPKWLTVISETRRSISKGAVSYS